MPTVSSRRLARSSALAGLSCALAALACDRAYAQPIELEGIVVEGVSLDFTPQSLSSTGSAVTVVGGDQLEKQQVRHAGDALRSLPGVHVGRTGGFAGLTEVRIRGAESNHTLVLIDGIEANATTNGLFSFSDLLTEDIERIEVIRGPQSGLFGSHALGGVVNIVTRARPGPAEISASTEYGSFGTHDIRGTVSGGSEKMYGALTLQQRESNGFNIAPEGSETDASTHRSASFKGGMRPFENVDVEMVVRHLKKTGDRDGEGGPDGTLAVQVDTPSHFSTEILLAGTTATWSTFGGRWVHKFAGNVNETSRGDTDVSSFGAFFSQNDSKAWRTQYLSTLNAETPGLAGGRHRLTGMVERQVETFTPVTADNITRRRETVSLAADYHAEFLDHLSVHAAVRQDSIDALEDFSTYRLAASLQVPETPFRLHSSVGTGVKVPNMFEQFGTIPALFVPNPNLEPEESFGWDAGVETRLFGGKALVDVTYFEADLSNKIETVFLPGFLSTPVNLAGTSRRQGIEVSGRLRLSERVEIGGDYTLLEATEPDGDKERRRPGHSGRAFVNVSFAQGRGTLNATAVYNGNMEDFGFLLPLFTPVRVTLDDYTLVSLAASYEVRPGKKLFARVENLLDQDYQEIFGFATPGLAAYAGIKLTLGGPEVAGR